jgi:hypothetical protein
MKMSRRRIVWAAIAVVLTLVGVFVITPIVRIVRFMAFLRTLARTAERGRDHLFFETDYGELLAACRELSRRVASGELDAGGCFFYSGKHDLQALSIPQAIRDIEPAIIWFDTYCKGDVCIEVRPGPDWYGVVAYPEGQEGSGDIKLIDGLWYCDADYREPYLEYMKWIDAKVEEGRRAREKRESAHTQPASGQQ